jgi:hypothetical protein
LQLTGVARESRIVILDSGASAVAERAGQPAAPLIIVSYDELQLKITKHSDKPRAKRNFQHRPIIAVIFGPNCYIQRENNPVVHRLPQDVVQSLKLVSNDPKMRFDVWINTQGNGDTIRATEVDTVGLSRQ